MRAIADLLFKLAGGVLAVLLLLACLFYFVSLPGLPMVDALSIGVPWLMAGNLVFAVYWTLRMKRQILVPLLPLAIAVLSFGWVYRIGAGDKGLAEENSFSVMSFNVRGFSTERFGPGEMADSIRVLIKENDPDIICFQEFHRLEIKQIQSYGYQYVTPTDLNKIVQGIFSRFPIVARGVIPFPDSYNNAIFADLRIGRDTLRVYNVHLESYKIGSRNFLIQNYGQDFAMRLNAVGAKQREQAALVRAHQQACPYPFIVSGDFNATAFSRPYRIIGRGLQDSFREKGTGWGATYFLNQVLPYRIDFILATDDFQILEHQNFEVHLSDHLPVQATLRIKSH